ncbi:uncharacterized protein [Primulina eburnea]|uniref:uncharacterized protein n=1 Tax=Primulina eburnea TaxID=1245227 RepID=UPI003C6C507A
MKSKVEVPGIPPERPKTSAKITDEFSKASFKDQDIKVPKSTSTGKTKPNTGSNVTPSMKKKASYADIGLKDERTSNKSKNPVAETPPTFAFKNLNITTGSEKAEIPAPTPAAKLGPRESMADAWEKEAMTRVGERHEKMMDTIEKWETKKMTNATRKVKRRENNFQAEMDKRAIESTSQESKKLQKQPGQGREEPQK